MDRVAQKELYIQYAARLLTLCRRYCNNYQEAEDILHDTFLIAFDHISAFKYKGVGSLYAWLSRIAINQAIDRIRKNHWKRLPIRTQFREEEESEEIEEGDLINISQEELLEIIAGLPKVRRAVFNLYCLDGYSHKEIATMLEISEKGSASILAKAKSQLKKEVRRYLNNNRER